jgi:hypothetical protein
MYPNQDNQVNIPDAADPGMPNATPSDEVAQVANFNQAVEPVQPDAGIEYVAGAEQPSDNGRESRLQQENANQKRALEALGVDPESDQVKQFEAGIISKEELLGVAPLQRPSYQEVPPNQLPAPEVTARQKYDEIRHKIAHSSEVSQEDYQESLKLQIQIESEDRNLREQQDREISMNESIQSVSSAVKNVAIQSGLTQGMDEATAATVEQMFLASTDQIVSQASNGDQSKYFRPEVYQYYAERNISNFQKLASYFLEQGRSGGTVPTAPALSVSPLGIQDGSSGSVQPVSPVTGRNFQDRARAYEAQLKVRV